jgi:3-oxoadipate enol-lactonase
MPYINIRGVKLHYTDTQDGSETIVFSHGVLWSGKMFEAQIAALRSQYRCIAFDHRGQGQSEVTTEGYDMDSLSLDASELIQTLVGGSVHFVGLSMGGFVGMRLAARRPDLVKSLTLLETSAAEEPAENVPQYRLLLKVMNWTGFGLVTGKVMRIMFGQKFMQDPSRKALRRQWENELKMNSRRGITLAMQGIINRRPVLDELPRIQCPTLVIVGDQDVATVPAKAKQIHEHISGSELVILEGAGHTATVEEPEQVNAAMRRFLEGLSA